MTHTDTEPTEHTDTDQPTNALAAWLWPGEWREALARWVLTIIAIAIGATALYIHPWLRWTLGAATVLALTLAAARRRAEQAEDQEPQGQTDNEEDEDPPTPGPAEITDIVTELGHGTGVLLTRIRMQLLEEYQGCAGWTTKDVRALLAEAGVRVREGVRVTGVGNGPGVHREDIPAPLSPAPATTLVGVVGAGQDANTNTNNATVVRHAGGAHITVTPPRQTTP
ncbi:hypothetical protein GTX53_24365 [Streptomyces sp. SID5594]|uniref:hypothetical protein n=1 Tax=unclassified Streptomyces TaxID=2593676 RepID=UPI000367C503|nr:MULTISPECIES: hypothetical protein [unclassified Streptomyces]MZF56927.1 hypothetical protein [Streptomyces sp. SID5594]